MAWFNAPEQMLIVRGEHGLVKEVLRDEDESFLQVRDGLCGEHRLSVGPARKQHVGRVAHLPQAVVRAECMGGQKGM